MEFQAWPKTTRLFRDIVVTEKIDGTNAAIIFEDDEVGAQSRKRLITPDSDNFGFARWVYDNKDELYDMLGEGIHFGEWWGKGIQRGYDRGGKNFSLFNTSRNQDLWSAPAVDGVPVRPVPILHQGEFSEAEILDCLGYLKRQGSVAAPGYMNPEGICVFHTQSRIVQKVTLDNEDRWKWERDGR